MESVSPSGLSTSIYWKCKLINDPETDEEFYDIAEEGILIEGWEGKTFIRLYIPNK